MPLLRLCKRGEGGGDTALKRKRGTPRAAVRGVPPAAAAGNHHAVVDSDCERAAVRVADGEVARVHLHPHRQLRAAPRRLAAARLNAVAVVGAVDEGAVLRLPHREGAPQPSDGCRCNFVLCIRRIGSVR